MIPKVQLLEIAKQQELRPTIVEKDYVLGWLRYALVQRFIERFQAVQAFDADDQETVIKLIDAMIVKRRVEEALQVDRKAG